MIHLLEVSAELTVEQLRKLSRRYAMTGGVELCLRPGLSRTELSKMRQYFNASQEQSILTPAQWRTSNVGRILAMIEVELRETESADLAAEPLL